MLCARGQMSSDRSPAGHFAQSSRGAGRRTSILEDRPGAEKVWRICDPWRQGQGKPASMHAVWPGLKVRLGSQRPPARHAMRRAGMELRRGQGAALAAGSVNATRCGLIVQASCRRESPGPTPGRASPLSGEVAGPLGTWSLRATSMVGIIREPTPSPRQPGRSCSPDPSHFRALIDAPLPRAY